MVKFSFVMGLAALAPLAMAQPIAQEEQGGVSGFSFEDWAKSIIADPEGDHLSPDQALSSALKDGTVSSSSSSSRKRQGPNDVICNRNGFKSATVSDFPPS